MESKIGSGIVGHTGFHWRCDTNGEPKRFESASDVSTQEVLEGSILPILSTKPLTDLLHKLHAPGAKDCCVAGETTGWCVLVLDI